MGTLRPRRQARPGRAQTSSPRTPISLKLGMVKLAADQPKPGMDGLAAYADQLTPGLDEFAA